MANAALTPQQEDRRGRGSLGTDPTVAAWQWSLLLPQGHPSGPQGSAVRRAASEVVFMLLTWLTVLRALCRMCRGTSG